MFIVTKRFGRAESRLSDFKKEQDAIAYIMERLNEDKGVQSTATYGLYEGADLLKEYTQQDIPVSANKTNDEASDSGPGSQRSSGRSFAPTPFDTSPRMGPRTWVRDAGEDESDKK